MKRIGALFICFILLTFQAVSAKSPETLKDVSERVKILEGHKENLDDQFNIKMGEFKGKIDFKASELALENSKAGIKLKNDYDYIKLISWVFGSLSVGGILVVFFSFIAYVIWCCKKIREISKQIVNEKFESLFNEKKEKLIMLINSQDEELNLKQNKKILVISPENSEDSFLRSFFTKMRFQRHEYENYDPGLDCKSYDLILVNDESGGNDQVWIENIIEKSSPTTIFFYYGKYFDYPENIKNRFASANIKSQLYGNLINALRYQEILKS